MTILSTDVVGLPTETETHSFLAKDGKWYPSYSSMASANRRANEDYLRSMGLDGKMKGTSKQEKKRKNAVEKLMDNDFAVTYAGRTRSSNRPLRTSNRVRGKKAAPIEELYGNGDNERAIPRSYRQKRRKIIGSRTGPRSKGGGDDFTAEELKELENLPDWTDGMHNYLLTVPHGNSNRVVSEVNARAVMRQVAKLVAGVGITYHHWKPGTYFMKGTKVHLGMDFDGLYDDAVSMENTYGRDLGNGWLLRHPLKKLKLYQEYRSVNEAKMKRVT